MDLSHLVNDDAKCRAMMTSAERIRVIQSDHWFQYKRADETLKAMERLFKHAIVSRPPNIFLIGESMAGKSSLLRRFSEHMHPRRRFPEEPADYVPVLSVSMPAECPRPAEFLQSLLIAINSRFSSKEKPDILMSRLQVLLAKLETRVIVIDEFHHILQGSAPKALALRDQIKLLGSATRIPIIAAGLDTARNVFSNDPQMHNRFKPIELERFDLGNGEDVIEVSKIVKKWLQECPLRKASGTKEAYEAIVEGIFKSTGGLIGYIVQFLQMASEFAINSQEECINGRTLERMGWKIPSDAFPKYKGRSH